VSENPNLEYAETDPDAARRIANKLHNLLTGEERVYALTAVIMVLASIAITECKTVDQAIELAHSWHPTLDETIVGNFDYIRRRAAEIARRKHN